MTESQFTQELLRNLRRMSPKSVIVKITDMYTGGIPDFFISRRGLVTFFEVKVTDLACPPWPTGMFKPAQWETLRKLERGYYIIKMKKEYSLFHVEHDKVFSSESNCRAYHFASPRFFTLRELLFEIVRRSEEAMR